MLISLERGRHFSFGRDSYDRSAQANSGIASMKHMKHSNMAQPLPVSGCMSCHVIMPSSVGEWLHAIGLSGFMLSAFQPV